MVNMANIATLEDAYNIAKRWEESTMRAHYGYNYKQELDSNPLLGRHLQSIYNQLSMDGYK
jgi:hypothetical protein